MVIEAVAENVKPLFASTTKLVTGVNALVATRNVPEFEPCETAEPAAAVNVYAVEYTKV